MAYRILYIGGPADGEEHVTPNPWDESWPHNHVYEAERHEDGSIVMTDGDDGSGIVEMITQDGAFTPPMQTIRLYSTGRKKMSDEAWNAEMERERKFWDEIRKKSK